MNEHDANRALIDAAALRDCPHIRNYDGLCAMCDMPMPDPLEQTQRMPVADRRYRMVEGRRFHEEMRGDGHARAMLNNPVYRNEEIARLHESRMQRQVDAEIDRQLRDFREYCLCDTLTAHQRAQLDGFSDET